MDLLRFISEFEGGAPEFNADRNIYTPTFVSKLTVFLFLIRMSAIIKQPTKFIRKDFGKISLRQLIQRLKIQKTFVSGSDLLRYLRK